MTADAAAEPARYALFLHGLGSSPMAWERQVAKLPPGLAAHAPWLRGLRPGGREEFGVADAAADLVMHLDLEGVPRAALIGHALGAMVALQVAMDHPDRVGHLVLVAGQARPPRAALAVQRALLGLVPARRLAERGVSKEKVREAMRSGGAFDATGALEGVAAPTLVVCGGADRANLPASRMIAARVPGARLEIIEGAGHDVMVERPDEVNGLLYPFLGV